MGITSGSLDSWDRSLVNGLTGKRIIIIPDNDVAGAKYAQAIVESLDRKKVQHDVVSLAVTGAKDLTELTEMDGRTVEDLKRLLPDWCHRRLANTF